MSLSIIIPLYNEEGNIELLLKSLYSELIDVDYELILIDDGSVDLTIKTILRNKNRNTKLLILDGNYGQSAAIDAGIVNSTQETIVIMDGDLQNDAKDIKKMLFVLEDSNCIMVQGYRKNRKDDFIKTFPSKIANKIIRMMFGLPIHDIGCSIKVFKRECISNFVYFNGFHRYIPLFISLNKGSLCELEVEHSPRYTGNSKYGISRTIQVICHLCLFKMGRLDKLPSLSYQIKEIL